MEVSEGVENVTLISLAQMIDLALGSQNPGIIHFDLLHEVLRVILEHLHLSDLRVKMKGRKSVELKQYTAGSKKSLIDISSSEKKRPSSAHSEQHSHPSKLSKPPSTPRIPATPKNSRNSVEAKNKKGQPGPNMVVVDSETKGVEHTVSITVEQVQWLFDSIGRLEEQINELKYLPNNKDLIAKISGSKLGSGGNDPNAESNTPVVDMFQILSLTRRLDAVEETMQKLASLIEDLAKDVAENAPKTDIPLIESITELKEQPISLLGNKAALDLLAKEVKFMKRLIVGEEPAEFGNEDANVHVQIKALEVRTKQTMDQVEALDVLFSEQIANLTDQCSGFENCLTTLECKVQQNEESSADPITNLSERCEVMESVLQDVRGKQIHFDNYISEHELQVAVLEEQMECLKITKVDKEEFISAMEKKLDAEEILRKVSNERFDTSVLGLKNDLDTMIDKLATQEELWQNALTDMQTEIVTKLEKKELLALQEFVAEKLRVLQQRIRAMKIYQKEQEAAATKQQLLKHLKCLSCDTDVGMRTKMSPQDYPRSADLPPTKTIAPYLAYELDVMRKQQRGLAASRNMHHFEAAMQKKGDRIENRYCGGPHTVTTPIQRVTRVGHFMEQWGPDIGSPGDNFIKGKDNNIYLGTRREDRNEEIGPTIIVEGSIAREKTSQMELENGKKQEVDVPEKDDTIQRDKVVFKKEEEEKTGSSTSVKSRGSIKSGEEKQQSQRSSLRKSVEVDEAEDSKASGHIAKKISAFSFDEDPTRFPYL